MVILVRFGELGLKSPYVRKQLLDRLVGNIQDLFAAEGIECLTRSDRGRGDGGAEGRAAPPGGRHEGRRGARPYRCRARGSDVAGLGAPAPVPAARAPTRPRART